MAQANAQAIKSNVYTWHGIDRKGNRTQGEISSASAAMAKAMLRKQGVTPKRVSKKGKPMFEGGGKAIKAMDIAIFTRQLATMMKAGVPLIQSFEIVGEGLENKSMANLVREIKNDVAGGSSFAQSLAKHPRYFDELFVNLVGSGEQSGALETMLDRVAIYKEKSEALKSKIKKAMKYPITVVLVAVVVTGILLIKVVPQFATTFKSFGSELPVFTQMVVNLSEWTQQWWFMILAGIIGIGFTYREASLRSKPFRDFMDALMLKLPIVGNIINQAVYARFARTLATTFAAGVPLVDALDSVAGAAGNAVYYRAIKKIRDDVTGGIQLNVSIRETQLFPSMMLQMVAIGEESGALDAMLDKVASHYEAEVDNAVDGLTSMMEPLIMSVLGVLVGGLMIAMYLPIFMLGSVV